MPAPLIQQISRFDGRIAEDPRSTDFRFCATVKHFDTTYPHKLIPYPKTEADETKSMDIVKFIYAPGTTTTTFKLYGFGKASGSTASAVYSYDIDAGTPDSTSWTTPANNEGSTTARDERVFFHYKNYLYMWAGGTKLGRFGDLTSSPTFTDSYQSVTYTNVAQPVHHRADDIAYFFSDNNVHTLNNTSWTSNALVLPDNLIITAGAEYGNYLAIACAPKTPSGNLYSFSDSSVLFLWDRDSSVTTLSQRIDLGHGRVFALAELDGSLVALIDHHTNSLYGLVDSKIIVKRVSGSEAPTVRIIQTDNQSSTIYKGGTNNSNYLVQHDRLYFPASLINDGDTHAGIYCVDSTGKMSIEVVEEEATSYQGIYKTGGMWWIAHSNDGSVNRSDDNLTYTYTSIYETLKMDFGDRYMTKEPLSITILTEPLASGAQVVVRYRVDQETSYTTTMTHDTDNAIRKTAINIESSGAELPQFKELQIRLESTGGAIITGLRIKAQPIGDDIE